MPDVFAVIVAAGRGTRMGGDVLKQYLDMGGLSILSRTLEVFILHRQIGRIYLVVPENDFDFCRKMVIAPLMGSGREIHLIAGGKTRFDSVENGLAAIPASEGIVLVHDGVRPFVTPDIISACMAEAVKTKACIAAVPVADTLKMVSNGRITSTLERNSIFMAQTPQAFDLSLLKASFAFARSTGFTATDEAALVEHYGKPVSIVAGSRANIKITTPDDLALARALLHLG
ncbi:MAG: 2-C-methyl-D-erythritol 4-phosphate cytidylyltransferase [Deltaproteobacteria bacterium]|nr:2-C-methyl-D-erythritol 4-phosphate cytidylyltransferase [Deltaproteobacteria bacterium]